MNTKSARIELINRIRNLPQKLTQEVSGLTDEQLNTPYRENGWTIKQLVHHLADAHVNGLMRFKILYTEDNPTLRPYNQILWAEMPDAKEMEIEPSLLLLTALHKRLVNILENFTDEIFRKEAYHPEVGKITGDDLLVTYADHCDNHLAQITSLKTKMSW
jgi:hypothetical protein